jgi:hypothetical protein
VIALRNALIPICFALSGCSGIDVPAPYDKEFVIQGSVVDFSSHEPVPGVVVGFRHPAVPDSVVFSADSLLPYSDQTVPVVRISEADGSFELKFFPGIRDTSRYRSLFAYKQGYLIWSYNHEPVVIRQVSDQRDEIEIILVPK